MFTAIQSPTSLTDDDARVPEETWLRSWFPAAFSADLPAGTVSAVSVFGRRLVLFRDEHGAAAAAVDRCPHRGARLSAGRVQDGELECLYHGWRFGSDGACRHVPQLESDDRLPARAALEMLPTRELEGIVWVWPGEPDLARPEGLPTIPECVRPGMHRIDFAIDLPYGQDWLIENVLDLAHIHVAHDGVRGGGRRSAAGPLHFEIEQRGAAGFVAEFVKSSATKELSGASVEFRSPNLVHYVSRFADPDVCAGLALYSLPLEAGRCRLLYRAYGSHWPAEDLRRPRWREHLHQCRLLEQDMAVVAGQAYDLGRGTSPLSERWHPMRGSDALVVAYRRWIDEHALGRPGAMGFRSPGPGDIVPPPGRVDRRSLHVRQCVDCSRVMERLSLRRSRLRAALVLGLLLAASIPLPWSGLVAIVILAALLSYLRTDRWLNALTRETWLDVLAPGLPTAEER